MHAFRAARPSDEAQDLTHRLSEALESAELVDAAQLCILEVRAARSLIRMPAKALTRCFCASAGAPRVAPVP
jgi:hypothetical protein